MTSDLDAPLTETELEELAQHLPPTWTLWRLRGFLAAALSGPRSLPIVTVINAVLGEHAEESSLERTVELTFRLHNEVSEALAAFATETNGAAALCPTADRQDDLLTFCQGYKLGAELHPEWLKDDVAALPLLIIDVLAGNFPINQLPGPDGWPLAYPEQWLIEQRRRLPEHVVGLYHHFRELRNRGRAARIGRNDPCPCGSGKKHKRCCML